MKTKSNKPARARPPRVPRDSGAGEESAAAEAITASWMVSLLSALGCNLGALAANLAARHWHDSVRLQLLAGMLLLSAVVVGLATLFMTALAQRIRSEAPPRPLVAAGWLLGAAPQVALALRWWLLNP